MYTCSQLIIICDFGFVNVRLRHDRDVICCVGGVANAPARRSQFCGAYNCSRKKSVADKRRRVMTSFRRGASHNRNVFEKFPKNWSRNETQTYWEPQRFKCRFRAAAASLAALAKTDKGGYRLQKRSFCLRPKNLRGRYAACRPWLRWLRCYGFRWLRQATL